MLTHSPAAPDDLPTAPRWHALAVGLAALLLYASMAQDTLYGDGPQLAVWTTTGVEEHRYHFLYLPMLRALAAAVAPLGIELYGAACLLSALGGAVGTALTHVGCRRLGLGRTDCLLVAGLAACSPSVLFFATVWEVHGPFFAFAGLAFAAAVEVVRRPGAFTGVLLGAATGLSYAAHNSGMALVLPLGLLAWAELRQRGSPWGAPRRAATLAAWTVASHGAVVVLAYMFGRPTSPAAQSSTFDFIRDYYERTQDAWAQILPTLWSEWLWAHFPAALLCLVGYAKKSERLHLLALHAALVPYFLVSLFLVGDVDEHGAYTMPFAIPLAWLTVRSLPRPAALAAVALAAVVSVWVAADHDDPAASRALAAGMREVAGDRPITLLAGTRGELEASLAHLEGGRFLWLGSIMNNMPADRPTLLALLTEWVRREREQGRDVLFPDGARRQLEELAGSGQPVAPLILDHLDNALASEPVAGGVFSGRRLKTR